MMRTLVLLAGLALLPVHNGRAQDTATFTHADTLRGSITPQRSWWDVGFYDLHVRVNPADSSVSGYDAITYTVLRSAREMQIDLMMPLAVDSIIQDTRRLSHRRDGNALFVTLDSPQRIGERRTVTVFYHGHPRAAKHAPWDGGIVWTRDSLGAMWLATAVQGYGASGWWPTKDTQADEPDSQRVAITVPDPMVDVSNGRLRSVVHNPDGTSTFEWFVVSPINNYDVAANAGHYDHFSDTYHGESGPLTLDFWPLAYHMDAAKRQFKQVIPMLQCFEHWFGPFPWYEDGYKLVETPHLGMEHQSAVAYGNKFENGYLGRDLSGTGWGLKWDFIIVHESAHEWWGNSITSADLADMWVHESFANYAENIYTECQSGKAAGSAYVIGTRKAIRNDRPIVAHFGVNAEGSGDMYYKGGNMLHTIRQLVNDDEKWRGILRGLSATFRHQVVTGAQVQDYITRQSGLDLRPVFAQYLTTTKVPVLEYQLDGSSLVYRWADVMPDFAMPIRVALVNPAFPVDAPSWFLIHPTTEWQKANGAVSGNLQLRVDENYYVRTRAYPATAELP